jgi:hypothetical protein
MDTEVSKIFVFDLKMKEEPAPETLSFDTNETIKNVEHVRHFV